MTAATAEAISAPIPPHPCDSLLRAAPHQSVALVFLCSKLPTWAQAVVPKIFYVTEKAWNYYPYTKTGEHAEQEALRELD